MPAHNLSWWLVLARPAVVILVVAGALLMSATLVTRQPTVQALSVDSSVEGPPAFFTLQDNTANYALEYPAAWSVDFEEGWLTTLYPSTGTTVTRTSEAAVPKIEIVPVVGATTLGQLFEDVRLEGPEIRDIRPRPINGVPALQLDVMTFTGEPAHLVLVVFGDRGLRIMAYDRISALQPILDTLRPARSVSPGTGRVAY